MPALDAAESGVTLDTSPTDFRPYKALRLQQFDGSSYRLVGDVIRVEGQ